MPDPVTALVVGGTTIASGYMAGESSEEAAEIQAGAADVGVAETQRQFDIMQELLAPYVEAGVPALEQQQALLGLTGTEAQQAAITGIQESPLLQSQIQQGEQALLQQASATGGLRGGNIQGALAQYAPAMLSQAIQDQYTNLGGITSLGQSSAAGVGAAGMQTAGNISDLLAQQAAAEAGGVLGSTAGYTTALNTIPQAIGTYYGLTGQSPF